MLVGVHSAAAQTQCPAPPANLNGFPSCAVPSWLDTGSNAWMLTAATLVGLQSVPGLALYYGGLTRKKFALNTAMMTFYAFAAVLVVWVVAGYNLGFGQPSASFSFGGTTYYLLGKLLPATPGIFEGSQALVGPGTNGAGLALNVPSVTIVWFQFVFAAITPILFIGAVVERMAFKAWMIIVPAWSLLVYSPLAYWLFAGGWLNQLGAVDFSGGYVIHLDAGIAGLAAAMAIGPRAIGKRGMRPNNLMFVLVGAGLVWLGWNGFNGGDPYGSTVDASIAILNTDLAAAVSAITWILMDMKGIGKPTLTGAMSGAITGLVAITPAAGYVSGWGAIVIGVFSGVLPWLAFYKLMPRLKVDDPLGVFPGHGVAGLTGGVLTGFLADPSVTQYIYPGLTGAFFGNFYLVEIQVFAAAVTIAYSFVLTYIIFKVVGKITPLQETEPTLKLGDLGIHGEVAYPEEGETDEMTGTTG
ncbi:MAG: ammonium transporter [Nitrososphaerota archaeon]|nr:ammonium transporter [Nitrososphaerota archaeon]